MIELFEQNLRTADRNSSKGNQLKWEDENIWYKADYTGYEGLSEYIISHLLNYSTLTEQEYVLYDLEKIKYKHQVLNGCKSRNFLSEDWQIITLERLFSQHYGKSLYKCLWSITEPSDRFDFLCIQAQKLSGIPDIDIYLAKLITLDAFFKNEDRHLHNIALLMNSKGAFQLCPVFDNGGALLSDTTLDYPLSADVYMLMNEVKAKTFSNDFNEQLDVVENRCGSTLKFTFSHREVEQLLNGIENYSAEVIDRVRNIIYEQMRVYSYLFK